MAREVLRVRMSRRKVVAAAQGAIAKARVNHRVDTMTVRSLMRVARTAPKFAVGRWTMNGECGCLVGNLIGHPPSETTDDGLALYAVGMAFDRLMEDALSEKTHARRAGLEQPLVITAVDW